MPRPIVATISTAAMAHNLALVRQYLSPIDSNHKLPTRIVAVAKANAYGHGLEAAVSGFAAADAMGVIEVEALTKLRDLGWQKELVLLEGFFDESDLAVLQLTQATTVIHCQEQLTTLQRLLQGAKQKLMVKLNTGMNRLGFKVSEVSAVFAQLRELQATQQVGQVFLIMHFADADAIDRGSLDAAWHEFNKALQDLENSQIKLDGISVCNSAATLRFAAELSHANYQNMVRPGLCLYGASPFTELPSMSASELGLQPVMTLKAKILAIQTVEAGEAVGYGSRFRATERTRVGVVACGYADGYPRWADASTPVVVNGARTHLIGRVSMDMLTINLSPLPDTQVGDWVTLWGEGGPSIDEVTACAAAGAYEVLCHLNQRVPKQII